MVVPYWTYDNENGGHYDLTSDAQTTTQVEDPDVLGGHSDRARNNRDALNLINKLRGTGVGLDVDLPIITAIGQQSSGKSSLMEQVSGIRFPRNSGTCTRVPIECHLSRSDDPWVCRVKIRIVTSTGIDDKYFGSPIASPQSLVDRIARAQAAILNPSQDSLSYLSCAVGDLEQLEINFSSNVICLEIAGQDIPDLTLVDLPGLIQSASANGDAADIALVRDLVVQYISKPSTIILVTVVCETDFNNQPGYQLARQCDPKGDRTFGVLTKPDRIQTGTEAAWISLLKNESAGAPLTNGWYTVKMPELSPLHPAPTRAEAATQEDKWFEKETHERSSPWSSLSHATKRRLGTKYLVPALEVALSDLVRQRVPALGVELRDKAQDVEKQLRDLPALSSADNAIGEIFRLINGFTHCSDAEVHGRPLASPEQDGQTLLHGVHDAAEQFQMSLLATYPDFRPWRQGAEGKGDLPLALPRFVLGNNAVSPLKRTGEPILVEHVEETIARGRKAGRGVPDYIPSDAPAGYAKAAICDWALPARVLVDGTYQHLNKYLLALVKRHFGQYEHGGLCSEVRRIVNLHLSECRDEAEKRIEWLQKIDGEAYTSNANVHRELKDQFKLHFKAASQSSGLDFLQRRLDMRPYNPTGRDEVPTQFKNDMEAAIKNLNKIGVRIGDAHQLSTLNPSPDDPLLDVMASASALFEIARRRFSDYAPQAVYLEQVRGFQDGLDKLLREELGLTGTEIQSKCRAYLEESSDVKAHRQELTLQHERLTAARTELNAYFSMS
ncbi:unnamed protein product [Peniophora sp. CBMAI 1063]|nr:unnamed protein product [Peniophora sp. CBMAI 1063]